MSIWASLGVGVEAVAEPGLGVLRVAGGEGRADRRLVVGGGGRGHILRLEDGDGLLGQAGAGVPGGQGTEDAGIIREGLGGGVEDGERALVVSGGGGLVGAADRPVGPDGLHGAALFVGEVLPAAEQHELAIEAGVVAAVEQQPGVLDVDVGGSGGVLRGVVLLDAVDEDHRLLRLAERVVDGADGLQVFGVVLELDADRWRESAGPARAPPGRGPEPCRTASRPFQASGRSGFSVRTWR